MFKSVVEKTREDKKSKTMIRDITKGQKEEEEPEKETAVVPDLECGLINQTFTEHLL